MNHITPTQALISMRQLTKVGVPFSFSYMSLNTTKGISNGLKRVDSGLLRLGLRDDQSKLSNQLIAYTNTNETSDRFFHLPLLISFNNYQIIP